LKKVSEAFFAETRNRWSFCIFSAWALLTPPVWCKEKIFSRRTKQMNTLLPLYELGGLLGLHPSRAKRLADRGILDPDFVTPGNGRLYRTERVGELRSAVSHHNRKRKHQ
jgi:hypothetical protein